MNVILIRHSATLSNAHGVYAGRNGESLIHDQVPQSRVALINSFIADRQVSKAFSSPQLRCRTTLGLLSLPEEVEIAVDSRLDEMEMGCWTGLDGQTIAARYSEPWAQWRIAPHLVTFPGFEGLQSVSRRTMNWLATLRSEEGDVLAVTHETVIRAAVCGALEGGLKNYRRISVENLSLTEVSTAGEDWIVRRLNA